MPKNSRFWSSLCGPQISQASQDRRSHLPSIVLILVVIVRLGAAAAAAEEEEEEEGVMVRIERIQICRYVFFCLFAFTYRGSLLEKDRACWWAHLSGLGACHVSSCVSWSFDAKSAATLSLSDVARTFRLFHDCRINLQTFSGRNLHLFLFMDGENQRWHCYVHLSC